ncbi:cytochrome c oxidase assembly protein [Ramlibacter sp. MMS24-I3-19]|uniref:cytochrome c oxidase assembly protein n=1 Tax=Ramlibacter sp. MMS24-I3-19 TaxID=3416606 RepID=UPI003CFE1E43
MGAVSLLPLILGLLLPGVAAAHVPGPVAAPPSLWEWNLAPWLLALLLGSGVLYAHGIRRLWRSAGRGRGIPMTAVVAFALGWLTLVLALVSPLDPLGGRLFSAHMVQHELLMVVAAPLLVMGRPLAAWTWAFEPPVRQALGRTARTAPVQAVWQVLTEPMIAWGLHAVALWSWHVPSLFTAALENEGLHVLQHFTFFASALFFWWAALGHDPRRGQGTGQAIALLFTTMLHTAALGALLSLAPTPWYEPYIATTNALGIDPVDDQQLGGLVMWVPAGLAYVVVALVLLGRLITRQGREGRPRVH